MLTTVDIKRILKRVKHFGGVYPIDRLPILKKRPVSYIVNLDPSFKPGSHWVALTFDKNGYGTYFDPFGRKPEGNILTMLERFSPNGFTYSPNKYQDDNSILCGYYCILYILNAKKFNSYFKKCDTQVNEAKLIYLIKNFS